MSVVVVGYERAVRNLVIRSRHQHHWCPRVTCPIVSVECRLASPLGFRYVAASFFAPGLIGISIRDDQNGRRAIGTGERCAFGRRSIIYAFDLVRYNGGDNSRHNI